MSGHVKFPRARAIEVAREICAALKPVTTHLIVAGSLRRRKEAVGDVEIVYVPTWLEKQVGLFPGEVEPIDQAARVIEELRELDIIRPRLMQANQTFWGPKNKLAEHVPTGIPVDLFATAEDCWWNYVVCRTGGQISNQQIASAAIQKGWKWHPYRDGFTDQSGRVVKVTSERDVFELVGLPYLEPWDRP